MIQSRSYSDVDLFALARRINTPIWVYDTDFQRIAFANQAACELWGADNEACLQERDLSKDMSVTVAERLQQYQVDFFVRDAVFNETWTLYPNGVPTTVNVRFSGFEMPGGRMSMMCEVVGQNVQTTETLRSTQALLHTDVNIALFNCKGDILYKNPAAWNVLPNDNSTLEQLFLDPQDYYKCKNVWEREGESRCVTKIKTSLGEKWFDLSAKQCLDPNEGENALLITAFDVSELKKAEEIMQASKEEAESANIAKSEFLANMSHEIRTPMNGVLGMVDALSETKLDSQQKRCVEIIMQSGENLLNIINDVLDFSKIEAGKIILDPVRCNIKKTIGNIVHLFGPVATDKKLTLKFEYEDKLPEYFLADSTRLQQIVSNLIGNAIKFTKTGAVIVRVSGKVSDNIGHLNIEVEDTGIGISKHKTSSIFDKFSQAETSTTRKYGGTGLGLAISSKLASIMEGRLEVVSKLGQGSTFSFKVPLALARDKAPIVKSERSRRREPSKATETNEILKTSHAKKIDSRRIFHFLIVEDDETNRLVISSFLKNPRIRLSFAKNGREAVRSFKVQKFDLVFMDVAMPVMDGVEATEKIREYEQNAGAVHTPIICLSAHVAKDDRRKFLEAGMDDYLSKPLQRHELYKVMGNWLRLQKSKETTKSKEDIAFQKSKNV